LCKPTQAELTVRVEQRVDGLTPAQAGTEIFTVVLKKCVANALSLGDDGDHVVFLVRSMGWYARSV
jgi:hypothetical protein